MRMPSKRTLAVTTTVLLIAGGGAAYAFVVAGGTGNGTATTAAVQDLVLHGTVTNLAPGSTAPITVTYENPNTFDVVGKQIKVTIGTIPSECVPASPSTATAWFTKTDSSVGKFTFTKNKTAASPGSLTFTAPATGPTITFVDDPDVSQNACMTALASTGLAVTLDVVNS